MMIGRYIRQKLLKPFELLASKDIDISSIETTGIILGPYRNLTTLAVGIMALHPNIQVLNHAGQRILPNRLLNFFKNTDLSTYERFLRYAVHISKGGRRGDYGGSVTLSHAFTHDKIKDHYESRFGDKKIKDDIKCLFWKESLRISNYIKLHNVNLHNLIKTIPGLRFIQPVRNPMDCAKSNLKTGHAEIFGNIKGKPDIYSVISSILTEYKWFEEQQLQFQEHFLMFSEKNMNKEKLQDIARFLNLPEDKKWISDSLDVFDIKKSYKHDDKIIEHYSNELNRIFDNDSVFKNELERFIPA